MLLKKSLKNSLKNSLKKRTETIIELNDRCDWQQQESGKFNILK